MEKVEELTLTDEIRAAFHGDDPAQKDRALCRAYDFMIAHTAGDVDERYKAALVKLEAAATLVVEWLDRINDRDGTALGGPQWFEIGRAIAVARDALKSSGDTPPFDRERVRQWLFNLKDGAVDIAWVLDALERVGRGAKAEGEGG